MKTTLLIGTYMACTMPLSLDTIQRIGIFLFIGWVLTGEVGLSEVKLWRWTIGFKFDK